MKNECTQMCFLLIVFFVLSDRMAHDDAAGDARQPTGALANSWQGPLVCKNTICVSRSPHQSFATQDVTGGTTVAANVAVDRRLKSIAYEVTGVVCLGDDGRRWCPRQPLHVLQLR